MTGKLRKPVSATGEARSAQDGSWISREVQAMASAYLRGERISAEELLARYPGLDDETAIRFIFEEVCLRRESGQDIATTEIVKRFPRWKDELEVLLGFDRMLRPLSRVALFPRAGEELGSFRLLAELGRGACGKTYLATEPALLDRLVVLKVISDDQEEHLSLARLQHTHIIPLFSEQTFAERGVRALCMPYLGGASLTRILDEISEVPLAKRRGRHILEVLDRVQSGLVAPPHAEGPYRRYLDQASYVQAVCWIGACLADALHSTHAHGLIHMDVKPSNVLVAGDGLPMLLDFHLAHRPICSGELIADRLGGTPGWMAPEHHTALEAALHGQAVPEAVDHRADLYALGLLLKEALGGPIAPQDAPAGRPCLRRNPSVSVGLADIVEKCLAAKPADRYADAAALADDLRRQLSDLPLRGVPNRSLVERWRKWRRRRPAALTRWTAWLATCVAVFVALVVAQAFYRQRIGEIESALEDGRRLGDDGRFVEALHTLSRGIKRARTVPAAQHLSRALEDHHLKAQRGQKATALHELAELVRFRYGIELPAAPEARALMESISNIWKERDLLRATQAGTLDSGGDKTIKTDLLDLAIAWAELRAGLASAGEAETARCDALRFLDEVNRTCGPSQRLDRLRRTMAGTTSRDSSTEQNPVAVSALDHYDLGRSYLRAARFREAAREFQCVLDQRPQDFWPNFYQGICAYRLGQLHESLAAFRACIALSPHSAECYYNRARVAEALMRIDQAIRDYSRAVELDPALSAAFLNRGALAYKDGRHDEAIADFRQALSTASDTRTFGLVHYNLTLAYLARGDRAQALASAQEALNLGNDQARGLRDRLRVGR
jgi:serine/threonine protein kinase/Tfp pilus assembly protein PilF